MSPPCPWRCAPAGATAWGASRLARPPARGQRETPAGRSDAPVPPGDGRESIRPLDVGPTRRLNPGATFMEIHLDKRAVRQIRLSAADAIEEGDTEALREDILEAFTE